MYTNTLHLYTIHSILYRSLVQDSREYYTGTNMYKDLQGRKENKEMENKATCVCSHMLFCASLSESGVGGGLHQWVCSPAGQTVGGHEWVE